MNKMQLRQAVYDATQFADERDAASEARSDSDMRNRLWERLDAFLAILAPTLGEIDALTDQQMTAFRMRVAVNQNPLIDEQGPAQGQPE